MVNVYDGHENQEAGGEIVMEEIADKPRAGDKQSDAAGHERCEIDPQVPIRLACRAGFATLVVAGNPYILRGVKDGEDSTAVARLRHLISGAQFEKRGQHEPEELGYRESDWRDHGVNPVLADHALETKPGEDGKGSAQRETQGKSEFGGQAERKNQGIVRAAGFKTCLLYTSRCV